MSMYFVGIVAMSALITLGLRSLPFLIFSGNRKMPHWLDSLGRKLPAAIMAVLVVYCLKDVKTHPVSLGIPELIAAAVVVITYKWRHSTFLSIVLGTAVNMILIQVL